ncbi:MAG: MipA/OmpV family protein [Pseudomonadota bacterium]
MAALGLAACFSSEALAQRPGETAGWGIDVGAGLILAPSYLGDDAYQLSAVPNIRINYGDDFFASVRGGVGYNVIKRGSWRAGPIAVYDFGRDEDGGGGPFVIAGDDTDDLEGLGDVDGTIEFGGFLEYDTRPLNARIEVRQGLNGHEGLIGELSLRTGARFVIADRPVIFRIGPNVTLVDDTYNDAFFGVDAGQSAASGLDEFDADGGFLSYGVGSTVVVPLNGQVSAVGFARYRRLAADAADSSLVEDRGSANQGSFGIFLNYSF